MSYHPPAYGTPSPYPQPRKDNTLVWVLVTIAVMVFLCCCGVLGVFGWTGWVASQEISSAVSSVSSASSGETVDEGGPASIEGGSVAGGWSVLDTGGGLVPTDIQVTNEEDYPKAFSFYVNFVDDGTEVDDSMCTTETIEPGDTGPAACLPTLDPADELIYDGLTISDY